jgi:hypothetical protein
MGARHGSGLPRSYHLPCPSSRCQRKTPVGIVTTEHQPYPRDGSLMARISRHEQNGQALARRIPQNPGMQGKVYPTSVRTLSGGTPSPLVPGRSERARSPPCNQLQERVESAARTAATCPPVASVQMLRSHQNGVQNLTATFDRFANPVGDAIPGGNSTTPACKPIYGDHPANA